jgi:hypothetical protein
VAAVGCDRIGLGSNVVDHGRQQRDDLPQGAVERLQCEIQGGWAGVEMARPLEGRLWEQWRGRPGRRDEAARFFADLNMNKF